MAFLHVSRFAGQTKSVVVLRYGAAVVLVAMALGTALILRHDNLPHPFTSFSFSAIAISFWCAATGPGLLALLLSYLALSDLFVPVKIIWSSSESYLVIYGIFGTAVSWSSASRRRAERLLSEARDHRELRVAERTSELTETNNELQGIHAELRHEKDRLKLLLDLNNSIVSNLELRDFLRDIFASVRHVMQCDSVGVNLPDPETGELKLYALDFPDVKGFLREGILCPSGSLPAQVLSTGKPSTLSLRGGAPTNSAADATLHKDEGLQSSCWLPLITHDRALGVLELSRLGATPFSHDDVHFLMQVASQVAIAVENALAY